LRECLSLCVRDAQRDMLHSELLGNFSRLAPQCQRRPRDFAGGSSLFQYPVGTPALPNDLSTLNRQLRRWEKTYNCVRPHQSLAYLTPLEFITRWKLNLGKAKCH